jgi:hypothetical protein
LDRHIQEALARDESWQARGWIATSTQYRDLFDALLADPHPRVRGWGATNPRATLNDLEKMITDPSAVTRAIAVESGVRYPNDVQLIRLARDRSVNVQWAVIVRVGTPREAVEIVADEGDDMNRQQASFVLEEGWMPATVIASVMQSRDEAELLSPFV